MAVTVAQLGARVLRRLGVAAVPASERPSDPAIAPVAEIAQRALRLLGVNPIAAAAQPENDNTAFDADEVAVRVLQRLGVIDANETASDRDLETARASVIAVQDACSRLGLVSWPVTAVPFRALEHYAIMAAQFAAPTFGKPADMALYAAAQEALRLGTLSGAHGQALAEAEAQSVHAALLGAGLVDWTPAAIPARHTGEYAALTAARLGAIYGKAFDAAGAEDRVRRAVLLSRAPALAADQVQAVHADLAARGKARWTVFDIPDFAEEPYVVLAANRLAPSFERAPDPLAGQMAERDLLRAIALPSAGDVVVGSYF